MASGGSGLEKRVGDSRPRRRRGQMLLGLALIVGLIPIRVRCGNLRFSCAVPSPRGGIIYSYEVEPLAVTVVETLLGANMGLYYYSGREWVRP